MSHRWKLQPLFVLTLLALVVNPCADAWAEDGDLDLAFGAGGIVSTPINTRAIAVQGDGRIVVVGDVNGDFGVVRYLPNGTLDGTFGQGGIVQTDLGGTDSARAVALWPDGRILVSGTGLANYNPNGSLDTTFGSGGIVASVSADAIAIHAHEPDPLIIAVGGGRLTHLNSQGIVEFTAVLPLIIPCVDPPIGCAFGVPTFRAYKILSSGQILVAGSIPHIAIPIFYVARYRENGTPDTTFGINGARGGGAGSESDIAFAVGVRSDGTTVAAGSAVLIHFPPFFYYSGFGVALYDANGRLFGQGKISVPECLASTCPGSSASAIALQSDGKIILAGTSSISGGSLALIRLHSDGQRDMSFGPAGSVLTNVGTTLSAPTYATMQPDGKLLVAAGGVLVRYLATSPDDIEAPLIDCDEADDLWHAANITITCTATDSGSGLANAEQDAHFTLSTNVAIGEEWPNAFTSSRQICDQNGNCATAGPIGGNRIDRRLPTVVVTAPAAGSSFTLGQRTHADYVCHDGGSGVQSCNGTVATGARVKVSNVGQLTFSATAVDAVGNSTTATSPYTVSYGICLDGKRLAAKTGSTLPIKLELCDARGANVSARRIAVTALRVARVSGGDVGGGVGGRTVLPMDFRFRDGQYELEVHLKGFSPAIYALELKAGSDPKTHRVQFEVKAK